MSLFRRKRRAPVRYKPWEEAPDPRIFGRSYRGPSPAKIGLFLVALILAVSVLAFVNAFTKHFPFTGRGYELHATFQNATTLKPNSPVRIAGVDVGQVVSVSREGNMANVTFTVDDEGQPIHKDATITIRPRLFLEGNFFLDLRPGSPESTDLSSGDTIPVTQTGTAVQLDEILTSLQKNNRTDLQQALKGYGDALTHVPTAAEDKTQDPDVKGLTAAQALNETFKYGGTAGRDSSIVNNALLGQHSHDLSNLIRGQRNVFRELASDEGALKGLITNFNTTAGALASESTNLSATIRELAPTLEQARPTLLHLDQSLPPFRALAIQLEPGIRQLPETVRTGTPWLVQFKRLLRPQELGIDARYLAQAGPGLAQSAASAPSLFHQTDLLSRCTSHNLIPAGNTVIDNAGGAYPFSTGEPNYREFFYSFVQLAGESQDFDGNGSFVRFQAGGGPSLDKMNNPNGGSQNTSLWAHNISDPLGTRPVLLGLNKTPPFRMDVYRNPPPDINGPAAAVGPPDPKAVK
ncbi:MAG: MCE family protein [Actinobacteria bacterium]|nr:MAG: MCE family protein [Actinomycetota bacterium]